MSSLYTSRPGTVHLLSSASGSIPGSLINFASGDGPGDGMGAPKPVIITGIGYNQNVNIQFMPTLRKMVYVYAFGDKMGTLQVQGLAFNNPCDSSENAWGAQELLRYYQEKRAVKDGQTIGINFGNGQVSTVKGFLIGMNLSMASIELKTMAFTLNIATLPRSTPTGGGGAGVSGGDSFGAGTPARALAE